MSRIGKKTIKISEGVEVQVTADKITCKGQAGQLEQTLDPRLVVKVEDKTLTITTKDENNVDQETNAMWGTTSALIRNLIEGVSKGFTKKLEINGVGYSAQASGRKLTLKMGYSHPVEIEAPEGIEFKVEKNIISVTGIDKELVGQIAANVRAVRTPEPYKGKGIKHIDEHVRRKVGKKAVANEGAA
ncbi:50S ribosomal protein L6 [Patescibacteria group bacterium]|nr:50S ribosomal protein L6 [Patescibacteria group bacterium]